MKRLLAKALADVAGLPPDAIDKMAEHWAFVKSWNARVNLTSIEGDEEAAWLHYRDSLESLRVLGATGPWVDMGSGAGYPGVPLAIARPEVEVTLVEPRRKRASFLMTVKARLDLSNLRVLEGRSSDRPDRQYAALVTRATFSSEDELLACRGWLAAGGLIVALRAADSAALSGARVEPYALRSARHALHIWRL